MGREEEKSSTSLEFHKCKQMMWMIRGDNGQWGMEMNSVEERETEMQGRGRVKVDINKAAEEGRRENCGVHRMQVL